MFIFCTNPIFFVMRTITRFFVLCVTFMSAATLNAQKWVEIPRDATPIICISETVNEAPDVIEIFQTTQSAYHHDPRAPRFVLVDQEGKWGLGIGGYLQTKIEYDFDKAVDYAFSEGNMLIAEAAITGRELTCAVYYNGKEIVKVRIKF